MIRFLVAENRKNKDQRALPDKEVENISTHLLSRIHHGSTSVVDSAALGLLVLTYTHPEAVKTDGFENIIQEGIIEKYPLNDYLQAAGNSLLNLEEELEELTVPDDSRNPFELPPFQKAIPYFPHFGYQVTFVFENNQPDESIMKSIVLLIEKLKG